MTQKLLATVLILSASPSLACDRFEPDLAGEVGPQLAALSHLPGAWLADEVMAKSDGERFMVMSTYHVELDGAALAFSNYYVYEDGSCEETMTGLYAWNESAGTTQHFGVFKDGGLVFDAASLKTSAHQLDFKYVAPDGDETVWRSTDTHRDDGSYEMAASWLVDGQWRHANTITMRALETIPDASQRRAVFAQRSASED